MSETKGIKKVFSIIGLALCAIFVISTIVQIVCMRIPGVGNWVSNSSWGFWLVSFVPLYAIGVPVGLLILKGLPGEAPQENKISKGKLLVFFLISFFLMYAGNLIGTVLSLVLSLGRANNEILDYAMDNNPLKIIVMVILAPIIEEYIFRKVIIDKTHRYGEKVAVFFSALTFGLYHMNLYQFFYAFALGWVLAYIYTRTGRLRYTILIHAIINFQGSVIAPAVLSLVDLESGMSMIPAASTEEIPQLYAQLLLRLMVFMTYSSIMTGLTVSGLVFLIIKCRKLEWKESEFQLPGGSVVKTVYLNFGMIVFALLCTAFIILALF